MDSSPGSKLTALGDTAKFLGLSEFIWNTSLSCEGLWIVTVLLALCPSSHWNSSRAVGSGARDCSRSLYQSSPTVSFTNVTLPS